MNNRYYVVDNPNKTHPLDTIICEIELLNPCRTMQGNRLISEKYVRGFLAKRHKEPSRILKKKIKDR